jgi:uncharacterized Zn-binding protein involved in type VI secretion
MPPAARLGDMHTCPMQTPGTPPVPHVGGPILPACCPTVLIGYMPAARVGDLATCVGPPDTIVQGAMTVFIGYQPAARIGDMTVHGGLITVGEPTVLISDASGSVSPQVGPAVQQALLSARTSRGGSGGGGSGGSSGSGGGGNQAAQTTAMQEAGDEGIPLVEHCPYTQEHE